MTTLQSITDFARSNWTIFLLASAFCILFVAVCIVGSLRFLSGNNSTSRPMYAVIANVVFFLVYGAFVYFFSLFGGM